MDLERMIWLWYTVAVLTCRSASGEQDQSTNGTVKDKPKTFKEAEKEITDFINTLMRSLLPRVMEGSGRASLTPECVGGMMKVVGGVRKLKGWTLKMLDSISKPVAGILTGTQYSVGNYDECLDILVTRRGQETMNEQEAMFRGQYCEVNVKFSEAVVQRAREYQYRNVNISDLGKLKEVIQAIPFVPVTSEYMSHSLGLCVPSSCSEQDVQSILNGVPFPGSAGVKKCEIKSSFKVEYHQFIIMMLFLLLLCLVVLSSLLHWILRCLGKCGSLMKSDNRCVSVTISFSFCNNSKNFLEKIENSDYGSFEPCIRGITVFSVAWIVIGHTYLYPLDQLYVHSSSLGNLEYYLSQLYFAFVVSFPLAYEAMFLCYGFMLTFPLWQATCKNQAVKVNVFYLLVIHYIKLCLPLLLVLGLVVLLPVVGSGPFWSAVYERTVKNCEVDIWPSVGMYNNFIDVQKQCLPHLWFVSSLMQVIIVAIFISWILSKNLKLGVVIATLVTVGCSIPVGLVTYYNSYPPAYLAYFMHKSSDHFWKFNYAFPLSHFGSLAIGMLVGIRVAKKIHRVNIFISWLGWLLSLSMMFGIIVIPYYYKDIPMGNVWAAIYASTHRMLFSACVAWVILSCTSGNGGFINSLLSWKLMDPLYRLSYYAYLFHVAIIVFVVGISRAHFHYSHLELAFRSIAYIAASYVASFTLCMLLEMPLSSLMRATSPSHSGTLKVTPLNSLNRNKVSAIKEEKSGFFYPL